MTCPRSLPRYLRIASWALVGCACGLIGISAWRGGDAQASALWMRHASTLILAALVLSFINVFVSFAAARRGAGRKDREGGKTTTRED